MKVKSMNFGFYKITAYIPMAKGAKKGGVNSLFTSKLNNLPGINSEFALNNGPNVTNYKEIKLKFSGHSIKIGGTAHPDRYSYKAGIGYFLSELKKRGFTHLLALDVEKEKVISEVWCSDDKKREFKLVSVQDLEAPTDIDLQEIASFVKSKAKKGENVTIYCGEGWGRTGTVIASLTLRHLLEEALTDKGELESYFRNDNKLNKEIELGSKGRFQKVLITSFVEKAITMIRDIDHMNGDSNSTNGASVETKEQVQSLLDLEERIINEMMHTPRNFFSRGAALCCVS